VDFRTLQKADHVMNNKFTELLLDRGIVKAHEKFFVSLAHTEEDLDYTLAAFDSAIDELAA
jgi:glutamate-1-semialdehyde 2,1-aminomutase